MGVVILRSTDKYPLSKIGEYAGICWGSNTSDREKNIKRAKECIKSGHGRTLEYIDIELVIDGYSARCMREYERHVCGATFLQESTRYVNCENFDYYVPERLNELQKACFSSVMESIRDSYGKLIEAGVSKEDAANILPLGMHTTIVDKRNLRNIVNLMNQRLCSRAYIEIRGLANDIKKELSEYSEEWKWICDNLFVPKCDAAGRCTELKSCGRYK